MPNLDFFVWGYIHANFMVYYIPKTPAMDIIGRIVEEATHLTVIQRGRESMGGCCEATFVQMKGILEILIAIL